MLETCAGGNKLNQIGLQHTFMFLDVRDFEGVRKGELGFD